MVPETMGSTAPGAEHVEQRPCGSVRPEQAHARSRTPPFWRLFRPPAPCQSRPARSQLEYEKDLQFELCGSDRPSRALTVIDMRGANKNPRAAATHDRALSVDITVVCWLTFSDALWGWR